MLYILDFEIELLNLILNIEQLFSGNTFTNLLINAREIILFKRKSAVSVSTCNFYNSSIAFLYKHVLHIPWDQDVVPRMRMDARLPKVLSLSEVETLIAAASHIRNKAIIALLYSSGLKGVLEELPC